MVKLNHMYLLALVGYLSMLAEVYSDDESTENFIVFTNGAAGSRHMNTNAVNNDLTSMYADMVNRAMQLTSPKPNVETTSSASHPASVITYTYASVCRGFSARMTKRAAKVLNSFPGVLLVMEDGQNNLHTTHTPKFLGLTSGQLWPRSKFGKDVIVGIIDTGIWPESDSFNDRGMGPIPSRWKGICQVGTRFTSANCNKKLIGARYFYGGHEVKEGPIDQTKHLLSPRDTNGHGTHAASIAAGSTVDGANLNGLGKGQPARGMAFNSRVAIYKVCWRTCYDSDIIAAFDAAVKDGVDVISVSLGSVGPQLYHLQGNSIGSFGAMKKGIFVANSAGNNGGTMSSVVNIAPWVMTVGASTVDRTFSANAKLGNGNILHGQSWTPGNWGRSKFPLILASDAPFWTDRDPRQVANCAHGTLSDLVIGKIVVCRNDLINISPGEKGAEVLRAEGKGMIILDTIDSPFPEHHVLPAIHLGDLDSATLVVYMAATTNPTVELYPSTRLGVKPAPMMADFSSRGPSFYNPQILKPDITAPGVNILAAWHGNDSPTLRSDSNRVKFNIISGTSMATPHIAGLAALLRGVFPKWSPAMIKSALMTTATVTDNLKKLLTDQLTNGGVATPFAYGAGHVAPEKALNPGLVYDLTAKDYMNYLCSYGYTASQIQIFNLEPVKCPTIPVRVEDFNYPTFSATFKPSIKPLTVTFTRTLTNVGPVSSLYKAVVKPPKGVVITVTPETLSFTETAKRRTFTLKVTTSGAPTTAFASLTWIDGKHSVRSNIVITPAATLNFKFCDAIYSPRCASG